MRWFSVVTMGWLLLGVLMPWPADAEDFRLRAQIPVGSVGVVQVLGVKDNVAQVRLVFPNARSPVLKGLVPVEGQLALFDGRGEVARIPGKVSVERGLAGLELITQVPLRELTRPLQAPKGSAEIAAFVVVVPREKSAGFRVKEVEWRATDDVRLLDGDFDGDGKLEAVLYARVDAKTRHRTFWLLAGPHFDDLGGLELL